MKEPQKVARGNSLVVILGVVLATATWARRNLGASPGDSGLAGGVASVASEAARGAAWKPSAPDQVGE